MSSTSPDTEQAGHDVPEADLGTVRQVDDGWEVTFVRHLAHAPERVWRAVTEPEGLAAWFPCRVEGGWEPGARLRYAFEGESAAAAEEVGGFTEADMVGEVLGCEPPRRLVFTWNQDLIEVVVDAEGDGGSRLTFRTVLPERTHLCRAAAGWHQCLDLLRAGLGGPPAGDWQPAHDRYAQLVGPDPVPHVPHDRS